MSCKHSLTKRTLELLIKQQKVAKSCKPNTSEAPEALPPKAFEALRILLSEQGAYSFLLLTAAGAPDQKPSGAGRARWVRGTWRHRGYGGTCTRSEGQRRRTIPRPLPLARSRHPLRKGIREIFRFSKCYGIP